MRDSFIRAAKRPKVLCSLAVFAGIRRYLETGENDQNRSDCNGDAVLDQNDREFHVHMSS